MLSNTEERVTIAPSFVDLREFAKAAVAKLASQNDTTANPFMTNRYPLALPSGPVAIGAIHLSAGSGSVTAQEADEFIIVCDGHLTLSSQGQTLELADGDSAVLSAGGDVEWKCQQSATLLYMRYLESGVSESKLVAIDTSAELVTSGTPLAELLIGPTPHCRNHTDYVSADGEFICGTWDSTPYKRRHMTFKHFELMHLLEGAVTVEDHTGATHTFVSGDIFLVEQKAQCSWESTQQVKKIYAIYRPAS